MIAVIYVRPFSPQTWLDVTVEVCIIPQTWLDVTVEVCIILTMYKYVTFSKTLPLGRPDPAETSTPDVAL